MSHRIYQGVHDLWLCHRPGEEEAPGGSQGLFRTA